MMKKEEGIHEKKRCESLKRRILQYYSLKKLLNPRKMCKVIIRDGNKAKQGQISLFHIHPKRKNSTQIRYPIHTISR